jgi:hypothetical protein
MVLLFRGNEMQRGVGILLIIAGVLVAGVFVVLILFVIFANLIATRA